MHFLEFVIAWPLLWGPLLFALLIAEGLLAERDEEWWAGGLLLLVLVLLQFTTSLAPLTWALYNLDTFLLGLVGYALVGAVWAWSKWSWFVADRMDELEKAYQECLGRSQRPGVGRAEVHEQACRDVRARTGLDPSRPIPVSRYKGRIRAWIIWWPGSVAYFFCWEALTRLFDWVYARLAGLLQRTADRAWSRRRDRLSIPPTDDDRPEVGEGRP